MDAPITFPPMTNAEFTNSVARALGAFVGAREAQVDDGLVLLEMLDGTRFRLHVERMS